MKRTPGNQGTKPETKEKRLARYRRAHKPTIGIGEDAIRGRGEKASLPELDAGELGENIAQPEGAQAVARIDQDQCIQGGGVDFNGGAGGEFPE